jgi:central kinetochore subunit Mal2/MCM21
VLTLYLSVESLKRELKLQTTTLLAADSTRELLEDGPRNANGNRQRDTDKTAKAKLLAQCDKQVAHKQQCLYRACASITSLKIRDPDPNAVDRGNVLGLRFEVMSKSRFSRPYYVMLNRPYPNSRHLRIHRHTVPPCIPISGLAARYLPAPKPDVEEGDAPKQDLSQFTRALRRELVRYQNRVSIIGDLGKAAGLGSDNKGKGKQTDIALKHISATDPEAKQVRLEWDDGRTGRLVMGDDGEIVKMVAHGDNGRDREAVRQLRGGSVRVEELVRRLGGA